MNVSRTGDGYPSVESHFRALRGLHRFFRLSGAWVVAIAMLLLTGGAARAQDEDADADEAEETGRPPRPNRRRQNRKDCGSGT